MPHEFRSFRGRFVDFLKKNLDPRPSPLCPPVFDRAVDRTACGSRRRPDVYFDLLTHVLIVEIDEVAGRSRDQHKFDEVCENKRSMELFLDFAKRPIVMIRFNPIRSLLVNGQLLRNREIV